MALKWAQYAEKYGLQHLAATCERFIMLHFMDMAGSPELEQVCLKAYPLLAYSVSLSKLCSLGSTGSPAVLSGSYYMDQDCSTDSTSAACS
jgi:hypothetical protein